MLHFYVEGSVFQYSPCQVLLNVTPVMYERETKLYELYKAKEWLKPRYFKKCGVSKNPRIQRILHERGNSGQFRYSFVESFDFYPIKLVSESVPNIEENIMANIYRKVRTYQTYSVGDTNHTVCLVELYKHPGDKDPMVKGYCLDHWPDSSRPLLSNLDYVLLGAKRATL